MVNLCRQSMLVNLQEGYTVLRRGEETSQHLCMIHLFVIQNIIRDMQQNLSDTKNTLERDIDPNIAQSHLYATWPLHVTSTKQSYNFSY